MSTYEPKFKPGTMVAAKNGKGGVYEIVRIIPADRWGGARYDLDNGAVDIRKRGRSGFHPVEKIDNFYKEVR